MKTSKNPVKSTRRLRAAGGRVSISGSGDRKTPRVEPHFAKAFKAASAGSKRALSLVDLEIPVKDLLTHKEEIAYGKKIQAAFSRLRKSIPLTALGRELYLRQMTRVSIGAQVVVQWFPLREHLHEDIETVTGILDRARSDAGDKSIAQLTKKEGQNGLNRRVDRAVRVLRQYPLDFETLYQWGREIAAREASNPLALLERERNAVKVTLNSLKTIEESRDLLVLPNLRLVLKDVFRFNPTGMRRSDLFQEGILGLHRAVFRYDPTKKTRFSTYATYWIRQSIRKALIDRSRLIRVPQAVQEELRNPESRIKPDEAIRVRRIMNETVSMSADSDADPRDQVSFEAIRSSDGSNDEGFLLGVVPRAVRRALDDLNIREREVVRRRFGLGGDRAQTLEEIGVALHLSRERIRQIEREALEKMKREVDLQAVYEDIG